jgi:hypothetical protein
VLIIDVFPKNKRQVATFSLVAAGGVHWRQRTPAEVSRETDVADVDRDHQRIEPGPEV